MKAVKLGVRVDLTNPLTKRMFEPTLDHMQRRLESSLTRSQLIVILSLIGALAVVGYFQYSQFADYQYLSGRHIADIMRAKLWTVACLISCSLVVYWKRNDKIAPYLAVFFLSLYFVILYGILYRGTEYGMNGHWGDNGYRLAMTLKMSENGTFSDPYTKGFVSLYPPLWFYVTAFISKLLNLETWRMLKFGYLLLYLVYPWLIFLSWKSVVRPVTAAVIAIVVIFVGHKYLDYIYYEHISAALILPWWIYFFEDAQDKFKCKSNRPLHFIKGSVFGGLIFLTYYPFFFIVILSAPIGVIFRLANGSQLRDVARDLARKILLMCGVAIVSCPYWGPLLYSAVTVGFASSQSTWFSMPHANMTLHWDNSVMEAVFLILGVFSIGYLWNHWGKTRIALFAFSAIVLIALDRIVNLGKMSIQTRKVQEFAHVFLLTPLAIGVEKLWSETIRNENIRRGLLAMASVIALFYANSHSELYQNDLYKTGVNQRLPLAELKAFKNLDCSGTVILTARYIESCYLPYYLFVPMSNVPAHLASQFMERKRFLETLRTVKDPAVLSYAFAHNKFDKIDYIILPYNQEQMAYELKLNSVAFNSDFEFIKLYFDATTIHDSTYFFKPNEYAVFGVQAPNRSDQFDEKLSREFPEVYSYLASTEE